MFRVTELRFAGKAIPVKLEFDHTPDQLVLILENPDNDCRSEAVFDFKEIKDQLEPDTK